MISPVNLHARWRKGTAAWAALSAAAFALLVLAVPTAGARSLEALEKEALANTVANFDAAMRTSSFDRIVATMPPRVLNVIAADVGADVEMLRKALLEEIERIYKAIKLESFAMDVSKAEYKELPNGTPYAMLPTTAVIEVRNGTRLLNSTHSLAILDDNKWYLVRIDDVGLVGRIVEAYPEFTGIEFPSGTTMIIEPEAKK